MSTTKVVYMGCFSLHWLYLVVLIGYLFSKILHDRTQITQAGEFQAQKSPRREGYLELFVGWGGSAGAGTWTTVG